jgi:hypothetical protein
MQTKRGQPILQTEQPRIRPNGRVIAGTKEKLRTFGNYLHERPDKESEETR